jgi:hypothetical protein
MVEIWLNWPRQLALRTVARVAAYSFVAQVDPNALLLEAMEGLIQQKLSKEDQRLISDLEKKLMSGRLDRFPLASPGSANPSFKLSQAKTAPRQGSVKRAIWDQLVDKSFDRHDFAEAVLHAMNYDKTSGSFGVQTSFPSAERAVAAWFSEYKKEGRITQQS